MIFPFRSKLIFILMALFSWLVSGQTMPPLDDDGLPAIPKVQTSVYDYANIFPDGQQKALEQKLIRYGDSTGTQIVVASIPSLKGRDINFYTTNWAHKWGIGQEREDNGIFILIAPKERKVFIATGYGVEDRLTDALSKRIVEKILIPHFKKGDYIGGVNRAADVIFSILQGKFKAGNTLKNKNDDLWNVLIIALILFIIIFWLSKRYGGHGGDDGGYTIDRRGPVFWGGGFGGGTSSGGFGGFGGGGFSGGFGGGGFGGGGAGGSW